MNIARKLVLTAILASCLIPPSHAQDAPAEGIKRGGFVYSGDGAAPPPAGDDSLYQALGGREKIAAFTKDFVSRVASDDQIGHFFKETDLPRLAKKLTDQFIDLSGGPVQYRGGRMKPVHHDMKITEADFNRLAEDLQAAMDQADVPFAVQNRLIALLAPMERDIVK